MADPMTYEEGEIVEDEEMPDEDEDTADEDEEMLPFPGESSPQAPIAPVSAVKSPQKAAKFKRKNSRQKKQNDRAQNDRVTKNKYKTPCKFFLDGKCQKGRKCTFSHDFEVPKKEDICKFYLQGHCSKGDGCNFMHGSFPCKFFHTGAECYKNDMCRFSHAPLDEKSRQILDNYLKNNGRDDWTSVGGSVPGENCPRPFNDTLPFEGEQQCYDRPQQQYNDPDYDCDDSDEPFLRHIPNRPAILGPVPKFLKHSYQTYLWQQECLQLRKDYKGTKYNLFNIDNDHVIHVEPPGSLEEKEQYLRQTLSEEDFYDFMCAKEIKNHELEQKIIAEQEKLLAASAAQDVDLRKRTRDQPYIIPPAFGIDMTFLKKYLENGPLPELPQYAPPPPPPQYAPLPPPPPPSQPSIPAYGPEFTSPVTPVDPRRIDPRLSSSTVPVPPVVPHPEPAPVPAVSVQDPRITSLDPRTRGPRLVDPRTNSSPISPQVPVISRQTSLEDAFLPRKAFIKVYLQSLAPYRLKPTIRSRIDYSAYEELFKTDSGCKADPRLKNFFKPSRSAENNNITVKNENQSVEQMIENKLAAIKKSAQEMSDFKPEVRRSSSIDGNKKLKISNTFKVEIQSPPVATESNTLVDFGNILAQASAQLSPKPIVPDAKSNVEPAIPSYARGLLIQNTVPTLSNTSGLMSSFSLPPLFPKYSQIEGNPKTEQVYNDPDSDAEPDLVIASEFD